MRPSYRLDSEVFAELCRTGEASQLFSSSSGCECMFSALLESRAASVTHRKARAARRCPTVESGIPAEQSVAGVDADSAEGGASSSNRSDVAKCGGPVLRRLDRLVCTWAPARHPRRRFRKARPPLDTAEEEVEGAGFGAGVAPAPVPLLWSSGQRRLSSRRMLQLRYPSCIALKSPSSRPRCSGQSKSSMSFPNIESKPFF
jgi:hypothetical protein